MYDFHPHIRTSAPHHHAERFCVEFCAVADDDSSVLKASLGILREHAAQSEAVAAAGVCFCAELTRVESNQASLVHAGTLALVKWAAGAHPDNAVLKTLLPMVQVCVWLCVCVGRRAATHPLTYPHSLAF